MPEFYQPATRASFRIPPWGSRSRESTPAGSISLGHIFGVMRRHYRFILGLTLLGLAAGGFLVYRSPATYLAYRTLRVAGERRSLTDQLEGPAPEVARTTDPFLSLSYLVESRNVLGAVVDSLGMRLNSATEEFSATRLDSVYVAPTAPPDTILLTFYQNGVKAKLLDREARAPYGEVLDLGAVRFAVRSDSRCARQPAST